jgi:hypothetical protein
MNPKNHLYGIWITDPKGRRGAWLLDHANYNPDQSVPWVASQHEAKFRAATRSLYHRHSLRFYALPFLATIRESSLPFLRRSLK